MSRNRFIALSVITDAILVNAGFVVAFLLRFSGHLPSFNFKAYLILAPILTMLYLGGAWTYGLYDPERADTAWAVARGVLAAVTVGTMLTAAAAFFGGTRTVSFARSTFLLAWLINLVLLTGWRLALLHVAHVNWPEQRVLIVGTDRAAVELAQTVADRARWGWKVMGLIDPRGNSGPPLPAEVGGFPVIGSVRDVAGLTGDSQANRIIIVSPIAQRELVESVVLRDGGRVRVDVVPELYEIFIGTVDAIVGDVPLMEISPTTVPRYYVVTKRIVDVLGGIALLLLLSPVLGAACLAVFVREGRPVFFSQQRVGKNMKLFRIYKLRTMIRDAEQHCGPVIAEEDDPRITGVGRFLRRFRLDEIPQLVNIIKGDMSFVGPRPERPFFVERLCEELPGYRERFNVRPGVTGLAQVSGGYATTPERKLKYDLIYMYHQTPAMDVQIAAETVRVVLTGRGSR